MFRSKLSGELSLKSVAQKLTLRLFSAEICGNPHSSQVSIHRTIYSNNTQVVSLVAIRREERLASHFMEVVVVIYESIQSTRTARHYLLTFWTCSVAYAVWLFLLPTNAKPEQFLNPILFYVFIVGNHLHINWKRGTFTDLYLLGNQEFKIVTGWICDEVTWQGPISDVTRLVHQTDDPGEGVVEEYLVEVRGFGLFELIPWNADKFAKLSELTGIPIEHLELPSQPLVGLLWPDLKRHIEQRLPDAQV